jgi:hypothetical protein
MTQVCAKNLRFTAKTGSFSSKSFVFQGNTLYYFFTYVSWHNGCRVFARCNSHKQPPVAGKIFLKLFFDAVQPLGTGFQGAVRRRWPQPATSCCRRAINAGTGQFLLLVYHSRDAYRLHR